MSKHRFQFIRERDGNQCVSCQSEKDLTVDHVVPKSRGGFTHSANLMLLCADCNREKADIPVHIWIQRLEETLGGEGSRRAERIRVKLYELQVKQERYLAFCRERETLLRENGKSPTKSFYNRRELGSILDTDPLQLDVLGDWTGQVSLRLTHRDRIEVNYPYTKSSGLFEKLTRDGRDFYTGGQGDPTLYIVPVPGEEYEALMAPLASIGALYQFDFYGEVGEVIRK